MLSEFPNTVPKIPFAGNVDSRVINNATGELETRTNYLLEQLNEVTAGSALVASNEPCDAAVTAFSAVYWDAAAGAMAPTIAEVETAPGGQIRAAPAAVHLGVAIAKYGSNACDVAMSGKITLTAAELATLINNEPPVSGILYLSALVDGKLTLNAPLAKVPVGYLVVPTSSCDSKYHLFLGAGCVDAIFAPTIREFRLSAVPAGGHVPPALGGLHSIISPDAELPGWLPANHPVFGAPAPLGAVFGYNMSQDLQLAAIWPPSGDSLVLDFYSRSDIGIVGLKRVPENYYIVDATTIWWTTACYSQVPWDFKLDTTVIPTPEEECDIVAPTQLIARFEKSVLDNSARVVTKLSDSSDGVISFVNAADQPASRGELRAKFNTAAAVLNADALGATVLKTIEPGLKFKAGVMVEGVRSTGGITITGSASRLLDPEQAESPTNYRIQQGILNITTADAALGHDLSPSLVRLGDSLQRFYNGVSYIGLPSGTSTSVTCRFDIPVGTPEPKMLLPYTLMFGRIAGQFPELTMSEITISSPPQPGGPQLLTGASENVTFDVVTPSAGLGANRVIKVVAGHILVFAGDTVFVTISRASTAVPTFLDDVGLIRIGATLLPYDGR